MQGHCISANPAHCLPQMGALQGPSICPAVPCWMTSHLNRSDTCFGHSMYFQFLYMKILTLIFRLLLVRSSVRVSRVAFELLFCSSLQQQYAGGVSKKVAEEPAGRREALSPPWCMCQHFQGAQQASQHQKHPQWVCSKQ